MGRKLVKDDPHRFGKGAPLCAEMFCFHRSLRMLVGNLVEDPAFLVDDEQSILRSFL